MQLHLIGAALAALGVVGAAPSSVEERGYGDNGRDPHYPKSVTQFFRLRGNHTGIASVDGSFLGSRAVADTFVGFNLPYGQQPRIFGYDPNSAYVYAGSNSRGQPLILGAYTEPNSTAAIRPGIKGEKGQTPISCTVVIGVLFCGVNVGPTYYHDLVVVDYNKDGHYELGISPSSADGTVVSLQVVPA